MLYKPICKWDKKEAYLIQMFDEVHHWALEPKAIYLQLVLKKQAMQAYGDNVKGYHIRLYNPLIIITNTTMDNNSYIYKISIGQERSISLNKWSVEVKILQTYVSPRFMI